MDGPEPRAVALAPFGRAVAALLVLGALACARLPALPPWPSLL